MLHKTRAIALHSIKYSDTSIIAHTLTEKYGRQSFLIKGAYSKKAAIKANLFAPLNLLEMEVYYKETAELQKLKEAINHPPFQNIFTDHRKSAIAIFIAELLYRTIREEAQNIPLFDFLTNSIQLLDLETKSVADFHLVFMIQFSKYTGFFPSNNCTTENAFFDLLQGKFTNEHSSIGNTISRHESALLSGLIESNYATVDKLKIDHPSRILLLENLTTYYKLHIPGMGSIKSLAVLKAVFG
jgi:DNA repair protein RecO (recombination protein O)